MRRSLAALALAVVLPLPSLWPNAGQAGVVVKPGETLSEIADRNGISLKRLMQANGITNPNVVTAGQTLVIPGGGRGTSGGYSGRSNGGGSGGGSGGGTITVQEGDTLSEIADRAGISVDRLMRLNGLSDANKLSIGQKLVVGGGTRQAAAPKLLPTAPYTVKKGETVSELAERFGTTTNQLLALNNISDPKLLVAGSRIAIPGRPSNRVVGSSARQPGPTGEHVVASGESLSNIADRYNTSVDRLAAINKINDPNMVVAGTRLKLQAPPAPRPTPKQASKPVAKTPVAVKTTPAPKPVQQAAKPAATVKVAEAKPTVVPTSQTATASKAITETTQTSDNKAAVESKPVVAAKPVVVSKPAESKPVLTAKPVLAAKPLLAAKAEVTSRPVVESKPVEAKPVETKTPEAKSTEAKTVATTATRPSVSRSRPLTTRGNGPDWRNYGPLQVDWANWQSMGGSFVAPTLNGQGQPLYLAINCGARKLNTTTQSGQWKTWDAPSAEFEQQLVSDLCKAKGG